MPTGLRILDQLGCYDALLPEAQNVVDTKDYRDENGESITTTDGWEKLASEESGYPLFWIARTDLLKVLYDCIASVQRLQDTVEVATTDGPGYCGDILVGTDGVHSRVREEMIRHAKEQGTSKDYAEDHSINHWQVRVLFGKSTAVPGTCSSLADQSPLRGSSPNTPRQFSTFDEFCWNVLKVHPRNERVGTVSLRSGDPRHTPGINFRFFDERRGADHDLSSMAEGVGLAQEMFSRVSKVVGEQVEEHPDAHVQGDAVKQAIKHRAFSHRASSTCAIGSDNDPFACLDSKFRVRGVGGLRVVDALVFPRVSGAYLELPIFMISEKAADVVIQDAGYR
ncbi:GMC oxidoreductase-domain-containing protein [Aspergillus pseudodeflectus]|uniref:GMC oxidoreductase-domain-containing protein n=1 Tax=Aspergillus pseudodeflectus TaxID=176178 RepID=A0ABR4KDQ3_9EURO